MGRSGKVFTEFAIRALKPRTARYDVREPGGLTARVFPDGSISWCLIFIDQAGRKRRLTLGRYGDGSNGTLTLKMARSARDAAKVTINEGRDPVEERRQDRQAARLAYEQAQREPTVAAFFEEFAAHIDPPRNPRRPDDHKRRSPGVIHQYRRRIQKYLVETHGRRRVKDITQRDLVQILDGFLKPDRHPASGREIPPRPVERNRVLAAFRLFFEVAIERAVIADNPTARIRKQDEHPNNSRVLEDDEISVFWSSLDQSGLGESSRQCLRFTLLTGQRINETSQTPWSEIDMEAGIWRLAIRRMKQTSFTRQLLADRIEHHVLHLPPLALEILRKRRAAESDSAYVFPSPGRYRGKGDRAIRPDSIAVTLKRSFDVGCMQGIAPYTAHALRRSCRTGMERIGVDPAVSERLLMHAPPALVRIYNRHKYELEIRDALARWADHVERLLRGKTQEDGKVVPIQAGRS